VKPGENGITGGVGFTCGVVWRVGLGWEGWEGWEECKGAGGLERGRGERVGMAESDDGMVAAVVEVIELVWGCWEGWEGWVVSTRRLGLNGLFGVLES